MPEPVTPTPEQQAAIKSAVILMAVRFFKFPGAPLGTTVESGDGGIIAMSVRSPQNVKEILYGLGGRNWDVDIEELVTTEDVIRDGLKLDPDNYRGDPKSIELAISSAWSWVSSYLLSNGFAIGGL